MANFNDMFGNPNTEGMNQETPNVKSTNFNLSASQFMQHIEGAIQPIDCVKLLPNTKGNANYQLKIKLRNPSVRPLKNGMRFYVHAYIAKNKDLWDGWKPYLSQKISGETNLTVPCMDFWGADELRDNENKYQWTSLTPNSLANCFGIPWETYTSYYELGNFKATANNRYCFRPTPTNNPNWQNVVKDTQYTVLHALGNTDFKINALPFVAYQKIRRKYYMNFNDQWNNLGKNTAWYPVVEEDFKLPMQSTMIAGGVQWVNVLDHESPWHNTDLMLNNGNFRNILMRVNCLDIANRDITINDYDSETSNADLQTEVPFVHSGNIVGRDYPYLNSLGFRQVKGDYFTSGSPFPMLMRDGVQPSVSSKSVTFGNDGTEIALLGISAQGNLNTLGISSTADGQDLSYYQIASEANKNRYTHLVNQGGSFLGYAKQPTEGVSSSGSFMGAKVKNLFDVSGVTMSDLRLLTTMTKFKEKMGRISRLDYYNGVIESTFACNPNADNGDPIYVGGGSGTLGTFAEKSTNNTFNTAVPNGDIGNGECTLNINIGDFATNDHAYLIVVLSSQIDTIYPRALDRMWTTISYEQEYFPDFNALEPQATLRKEKDIDINSNLRENPLNYQDRYVEYKTRLSKVLGLGQSKKQVWDNYQYLTMTDEWYKSENSALSHTLHPRFLDNSILTVTNEPMFDVDILKNVHLREPLPYKAVPMEL